MLKTRQSRVIGLLYIFLLSLIPLQVSAEESTSASEPTDAGGFAYEVIQPENQRDKSVGYFDLRMAPGQQQTVQIKLVNTSDIDTIVSIKLNSAKTNSNGVIEYTPNALEKDASVTHDFVDIVKGPEEVTIPAGGETMVDLAITMPEAGFDGIVVGGIQLQNITNEGKEEQQTGTVINKYAYLVAMMLSENDTPVPHDLALNKVYAGLNNYRNTIFIDFSNINAAFVQDMTADVQISNKGSKDVLYDTKKAAMRMAPNSKIVFPVSMQGDRMVAGDYTAYIVVTTDQNKWEWTENFTITDEEADKYNDGDVSLLQETGIDWKLIAAIVGGVFLLLLLIFFIVRKFGEKDQKKKKGSKNGKKKNSRK